MPLPAGNATAGNATAGNRPWALASDVADALRRTLQVEMWRDAGLLRDGEGLRRAAACLAQLRARAAQAQAADPAAQPTREAAELRNLLDVAALIVRAALAREESRGAHYRNDFPRRDDAQYARHSLAVGAEPIAFAPRLL